MGWWQVVSADYGERIFQFNAENPAAAFQYMANTKPGGRWNIKDFSDSDRHGKKLLNND